MKLLYNMEQHSGNTGTAMISGFAFAFVNFFTGWFNSPLQILNIQQDASKALILGFVGAIGGLLGKQCYSYIAKFIKRKKTTR